MFNSRQDIYHKVRLSVRPEAETQRDIRGWWVGRGRRLVIYVGSNSAEYVWEEGDKDKCFSRVPSTTTVTPSRADFMRANSLTRIQKTPKPAVVAQTPLPPSHPVFPVFHLSVSPDDRFNFSLVFERGFPSTHETIVSFVHRERRIFFASPLTHRPYKILPFSSYTNPPCGYYLFPF